MVTILKDKILSGKSITIEEAKKIVKTKDIEDLCACANEIREKKCGNTVDTCSIINARSGQCSENCKWCAQSRHFATGVEEYDTISESELLEMAHHNNKCGVKRFSLVTSGRSVLQRDIEKFCNYYRTLKQDTNLYLCASMGLLGENELKALKEAGVKRYHCNLETSASYFKTLCTTHTPEDKKNTIRIAQSLGMEVCSGGIIGMGESMEQRIELAFELKELNIKSVPINILNPIPGTPLQDVEYISDEEIRRTVAIFRFILPDAVLRFAGGRARLSAELQAKILLGGMNGALIGDMLTTIGNRIDDDYRLFDSIGLLH
ncbi:MAG: biotin synthase BioB [Muribaculaceae bacterium]|nr:biotin synthase BioB [Muribaculaceae bacterium]